MRKTYWMIQNVRLNKLATNAMIECASGPIDLVAMDSAFAVDFTSRQRDLIFNLIVFVTSITCTN